MAEAPISEFGKLFEGTLKEADLEQIRALVLENNTPEVAGEVAHLLHQYSAVLDVAGRFASETSLDILLPQVIKVVTAALGAEVATLFLYDPDTDELWSRIARGVGVDEIRIPADAGIVGSVFQSGEHLEHPRRLCRSPFNPAVDIETGFKTRNIICVPLRNRQGSVIGATQVLNKRLPGDAQFNDANIALLSTITTHAASALEVAQLIQRAEQARVEESRMTEIMTAISSEISLDAVLAKIAAGATQLLGAERSTIFLYDSVTDELWSLVAEGAGTKEIRIPASTGIAGAVIHGDDVLIIPDAYADPRFNQDVDKESGFETRSILCVRVVNNDGEIVGVKQVLNRIVGPFADEDARRLRAFAAHAAAALENAELFDEVLRLKNYNEGILKSLSNGLSTGEVVAGTIGSARRMGYTVIGDTVNMAARLEAANKFYGTDLLLSSWTVDQLSSRDGLRQIDMLRVKGIAKPVTIFESLRHAPDHVREQLEQVVGFYSEGVNAYRHQDWDVAIAGFKKALAERPEDGPSSFYIDRCKYYMASPPPQDWDGVWTDRRK